MKRLFKNVIWLLTVLCIFYGGMCVIAFMVERLCELMPPM